MIIITRQIGQQKNKKTQKDLNSILSRWTFNDKSVKSAQEFLNKFEPWIDNQIKTKKELDKFLKKKGVESLKDLE